MATDLFNNYYNNPKKSYIYADILCSNAGSADDMSFDINGSAGQISDDNNVLSSIDLSDVHVGLTQYHSDLRTIGPNEYCYIRGMVFGDTYCSKSYGRIVGELTEDELWMQRGMLFFIIKYLDKNDGNVRVEYLKISGSEEEDITFIDTCNAYFESKNIPITVTYNDGYIIFTATETAYEFWVDHMMFWKSNDGKDIFSAIDEWMKENGKSYDFGWDDGYIEGNNFDGHSTNTANVYSSLLKKSDYTRLYNLLTCLDTQFQELLEESDVKKIHLYEDFTKYTPSMKYRNGAMLGAFINVIYPPYNAENITEFQKAVKIAHLVDRVQEFYAIPESLLEGTFTAVRKIIDVNDKVHSNYDKELYNKWLGFYSHINIDDDWIEADEIPQVMPEMIKEWEDSDVSYIRQGASIYKDIEYRDEMSLEGYCAYLSRTNNWNTVGQFYGRTTVQDDSEHPEVRNLIPSFIIYNPNNFPVQVKILTFA